MKNNIMTELNYNKNEKVVYTVNDLKNMLGIGLNQTYDLVKSGVFPVRKIGSKYLISKAGFNSWLNTGDAFDDIA